MTVDNSIYVSGNSNTEIPNSNWGRVPFGSTPAVVGTEVSIENDVDELPSVFSLGSGLWQMYFHVELSGSTVGGPIALQLGPALDDSSPINEGSLFTDDEILARTVILYPGDPTTVELFAVVDGDANPLVSLYVNNPLSGDSHPVFVGLATAFVADVLLPEEPAPPAPVYARFSSATDQSVAASTDVVVAFGTDVATNAAITKATQGAGHRFTFTKAGLWSITSTTRFKGGTAGERYSQFLTNNGVLTADGGSGATSTKETMNQSITAHFAVNDWIEVTAWQTGNTTLDLEGNNGWKNVQFALVQAD